MEKFKIKRKMLLIGIVFFTVMLTFTFVWIENVKAANTKEVGAAYAKIIKTYQKVMRQVKRDTKNNSYRGYDGYDNSINNNFADIIWLDESYSPGQDTLAYRIADYNHDGTPELFIGIKSKSYNYVKIFDVYTYDSQAKSILSYLPGQRCICSLCKNNLIEISGSSGAAESTTEFYSFPQDKKNLVEEIAILMENGQCFKRVNGVKTLTIVSI